MDEFCGKVHVVGGWRLAVGGFILRCSMSGAHLRHRAAAQFVWHVEQRGASRSAAVKAAAESGTHVPHSEKQRTHGSHGLVHAIGDRVNPSKNGTKASHGLIPVSHGHMNALWDMVVREPWTHACEPWTHSREPWTHECTLGVHEWSPKAGFT